MKFDDILTEIGEFGRYQRRVYFLICLVALPCAFTGLCQVFLAGESDHWCVVSELETEDCANWELSPEACDAAKKDASIPPQTRSNAPYEYDNCLRYNLTGVPFYPGVPVTDFTNDTFKCDAGWEYDTSRYESTIISEFDLVCSKSSIPGLAQSIYFVGVLVGGLFFGILSDSIGRYLAYFIAVGLFVTSGIATAFAPNATLYIVFRFFVGAANMGTFLIAFVLGTEFVGPSKRMIAGIGIQFLFAFGYMFLALLAFLIRDWFVLELVLTVPIVLIFLLIPIVSESPRWLMSKGRFEEAEEIIRKVARSNNAEIPKVLFEEHEKEQFLTAPTATVIDIFRTPKIRWRTLNLMFNWCVNSLVYYGLSLSTSDLGSDPYVAFFLSGLVEVPAYIWCIFGIERFGRKPNLIILLLLGGVACLLTIVIPIGVGRTTVAMLGKFCISATYAIIYVYTAELFPTSIRGAAVGVCAMAARIGGITAPLILIIGDYWYPLPFIIFGSSSIIAGALVIFLPETKGRKLPESIEEDEHFDMDIESPKKPSPETSAETNQAYVPDAGSDAEADSKL